MIHPRANKLAPHVTVINFQSKSNLTSVTPTTEGAKGAAMQNPT